MGQERTLREGLARRKYWLLSWLLLSLIVGWGMVVLFPPVGTSTLLFYVESDPPGSSHAPVPVDEHPPEVRKVFHLTTSTRTLDHLIEKFDLVMRYKIRTGRPFTQERARQRLLKQLDVRLLDGNTIKLTVKNKDRVLAANMANELFRFLSSLTEKESLTLLDRTAKIQDRIHKALEHRASEIEHDLLRLLDSTRNSPVDQTMRLELISTFEQELAQLARTQQELYSTYRAHQVATVMMRKEFTRPLVLIRKAGPDLSFDPFLAAIGRVALFGATSFGLFLGFLIMWLKNRPVLIREWAELQRIGPADGPDPVQDTAPFNGRHGPALLAGQDAPS
ncbi:MAG: hypothetical protein R2810_03405 [Flavobacteriales bacterium]|nr:hypothetical protein [Flavobacteriales bacterium]MCB0787875.1 hypothetical protein [Flavobacteriales bacterium]MCB0809402.1 hypothetical protein [Flavobacteriales bacterium]MCB0815267.1 hypothetical protein [Flavobacteriales bacterium]MCB0816868.1 hypothetical protein [Flavobacteriales bacterium]